jgi:hypothetical protein
VSTATYRTATILLRLPLIPLIPDSWLTLSVALRTESEPESGATWWRAAEVTVAAAAAAAAAAVAGRSESYNAYYLSVLSFPEAFQPAVPSSPVAARRPDSCGTRRSFAFAQLN